MTVIPAYWPPIAATDARSSEGTIVVLTGLALIGAALASTRWPASSRPPGVPASCDSNTRSSPSVPTFVFGG